jgi:hypothetical protein
MLFSSFSWTQFFVTVITLTSLYYLCIVSLLYRVEVVSFLKRILRPAIPQVIPGQGSPADETMGKVSSASEFSLSDPSAMDFADQEQDTSLDPDDQQKSELSPALEKQVCPATSLAEVAEFTGELKILFQAIRESGGDETLFNILFSSLVDRYPAIKTSVSRKALDTSILQMGTEVPSLKLSGQKLNQLWDKHPA